MSASSTTPTPYNVTIDNNSPTITYFPYRDGPLTGGWNITCAGSDDSTWFPQSFCVGSSSHRTSYVGASVSFQFEGTAAYLYGAGPSGSYGLQVDNQASSSLNPSPGLLAKVEGLAYGQHTISLNVTQLSVVSFSEVVLTIGLDTGGSTAAPKNRTLVPFTVNGGPPAITPSFSYSGDWFSDLPGTIGATGDTLYPRQHTSEAGASVTFTLNETSAFFMYGLVNVDLGPFTVAFQPPSGSPVTSNFNSTSRWIGLDQVMFWQAGLDRNKQYSVTITNEGQGDTPWFDFSRIDVIDSQPNSSNGTSNHKHGLSSGALGGIIAGAVALLLVIVACYLTRKRIKRTIYPEEKATSQLYADYTPASLPQNAPGSYFGALPYETTPMLPTQTHSSSNNLMQQSSPYTAPPASQPPSINIHPTSPLSQRPVLSSYSAEPSAPSTPSTPYANPNQGSVVALSWNEEQGSNQLTMTEDRSRKGPPRVVQEEDAGGLFSPTENVVRLPPGYQDSWNEGR